jgi:uncharacterized protein (TIGR03437 family)
MSLLKAVLLCSAVCFAASATEVRSLVTLPLQFEENRGQSDEQVRYLLRGGGVAGFFTDEEALFRLGGAASNSTIRLELVGRRDGVRPSGEDRAVSRSNYFLGNDAKRWRTSVPHFARIRYEEIYDGIDLVYYGRNRELEYDFVLQPGAGVDDVRMRFHGADSLELTEDGNLLVSVGDNRMVHRRPFVFQEIDNQVREVAARYVIGKDNLVRFQVDEFNREAPLVIDPVVEFSTYAGGSEVDENVSIYVDAEGNTYISGQTGSADFPVTPGSYDTSHNGPPDTSSGDLFVFKMDPAGTTLLQATFLGGTGRERTRCKGNAIALDAAGSIYLSGTTSSLNYPVTANAFDSSYNGGQDSGDGDAVFSVLSPDGSRLQYSTYLGGTGEEEDTCVDIGPDGIPALIGQTDSTNFPTTASAFAARPSGDWELFVAKIDPNKSGAASLVYSTYFGGEEREGDPSFVALPDGAIAAICETSSTAYPVTAGAFDRTYSGDGVSKDIGLFVLDASIAGPAGLRYSTYLGGSGDETLDGSGPAITFGPSGDLYFVGETLSTERSPIPMPITPDAFQTTHSDVDATATLDDAFFARIRPANSGAGDLIYSSFLGGKAVDQDGSITVSDTGYTFIAVHTESTDYPLLDPIQNRLAGAADLGISAFDPDGNLVFSTYYGGSGIDGAPAVFLSGQMPAGAPVNALGQRKAAADPALYVAGTTESTNYPTTAGVFATRNAGMVDVSLTKFSGFDFLSAPTPLATTLSAASFTAPVAPASIATVYIEGASYPHTFPGPGPAPTTLGGVSVQLIDAVEAEFSLQLFFLGGNQINLYIDDAAAVGEATVNVFDGDDLVGTGTVQIRRVAPGIFFVGNKVAAAFSLTVNPDNSRVQVETFDSTLAPRLIDLGPEGTSVYLLLFGTGVRAGAGNVTVTVGGESIPLLGALPHGTFIGLDQVNAGPLPRSLAGRGLVDIVVTVDGVVANTVQIRIK